jgi:hypothetical protein
MLFRPRIWPAVGSKVLLIRRHVLVRAFGVFRLWVVVDEPHEFRNGVLRWVPLGLLGCAFVVVRSGWSHSVHWGLLFAILAVVYSRWIPWRFVVTDDGLALHFPGRRAVWLTRAEVTVRIDLVGAFALIGRHRRFGYPLLDHVLYRPDHDEVMRRVFGDHGFTVT